ncbi:conserved hypothetical protein [uncultured Mycobacterium sp.]|uniref:SHOCT domain-containing protein n=2 Tax=Mycobacteriaceae TaxID=1762 RepID=A0A064C924_9MYCO|nr:hypothetical protein [Mycolicibacterium aromaticivorans]KDE97154.1 hypothetical protein Y900_028130 [Mycolicibacterium aromaticivorans JS19b1 = JCM 16368]SBS77552.1 conserved hypothetical protein [uncultured Mycobacterium sp.]
MMFWHDYNMGWWGYAGMGIGMVLFWALIIVGIVALIRFGNGSANTTATPPRMRQAISPEQVLADRFARAEIDATEYQRRIEVLRNHARQ